MARTIGRRSVFFGCIALLSLLLYYPIPSEFRWVAIFCAALAAFWAVTLGLEEWTNPNAGLGGAPPGRGAEPWSDRGPGLPFGPPPPPGGPPTP